MPFHEPARVRLIGEKLPNMTALPAVPNRAMNATATVLSGESVIEPRLPIRRIDAAITTRRLTHEPDVLESSTVARMCGKTDANRSWQR